MNKRVWVFQYKKEVEKKGQDSASWYVGWYDLEGKRHAESCGSGSRGKNQAEKRLRRIQSELDMGMHKPPQKKMWDDFRREYEEKVLSQLEPSSQVATKVGLDNFERHMKPGKVDSITTQMIDSFIASRRNDPGKKPKSKVSPATVNKDLRHIKAALNRAVEWGHLSKMPKIRMVKEPQKIPRYVTPEHFKVIYSTASDLAKLPDQNGQKYTSSQWWRALVTTAYMTGLRIKELLSLRVEDIDLDKCLLITRAKDNKGKRDEVMPLHPVVVDHLRPIIGESKMIFCWGHDLRALWTEFGRIQREVGIHVYCPEDHQHTKACHVYGFHDLRRAFATVNAPRMKPETLQKLMRHKSYKTTLGYINLSNQIQEAVSDMPVPEVLQQQYPPRPEEKEQDSD